MYKLVVSDFDGTLIDPYEAIPVSTMIEIDRIRKTGVLFCIATGRILKTVLEYNRSFAFLDYIIALNGAYVYDVNQEKVIYKKNILPSLIKKIHMKFSSYTLYFCTADQRLFVNDFASIYEKEKQNIYKVEIHGKNKKETQMIYKELCQLELNLHFNLQNYEEEFFVEITMKDITKFLGVEKICHLGKFDCLDVLAFGDSSNDLELISKVGYGVAVENASKEIKKIAKEITTSNDCKGIETFLKSHL